MDCILFLHMGFVFCYISNPLRSQCDLRDPKVVCSFRVYKNATKKCEQLTGTVISEVTTANEWNLKEGFQQI